MLLLSLKVMLVETLLSVWREEEEAGAVVRPSFILFEVLKLLDAR